MTDDIKADAIAVAFDAMRAQRKARKEASVVDHSPYFHGRAEEADRKAVNAIQALLEAMTS